MTSILIRCDASLTIGSGHVIRCRTLGRKLKRENKDPIFICRKQDGDLIDLLQQEFTVIALPELTLKPCDGLTGRELYGTWLGCSQEEDAADCLKALNKAGITNVTWLVIDHYGLDAAWQTEVINWLSLENKPPKLLVIDDLADRKHKADLLLDQNFFNDNTEQRYKELVAPRCRQLLGPQYALLGSEYAKIHPLVPARSEVRRVLVYFGGVDSDNLTARTIQALLDPALANLEVDVVMGLQSPHRRLVEELITQRPFTTLHNPMPSLAGLIARADLAVGAGGTTTWERNCLRLPSLVVTIAANQVPIAEALHHAGHLQLLGPASTISTEQIRLTLLSRITNPVKQITSESLTDGFGASRVVISMLGPQTAITLRPVDASDEALLLRWANDLQVRKNSFSPDLITPLDHHNWFIKGLADPNRLQFIATSADGCPIGQIRFDRQPNPAQSDSSEAIIDISLDRCARGYGLSNVLVRIGLQAMVKRWGTEIDAVADVLTTNAASNACFNRSGFVIEPMLDSFPPARPMHRWRRRANATPSSTIRAIG